MSVFVLIIIIVMSFVSTSLHKSLNEPSSRTRILTEFFISNTTSFDYGENTNRKIDFTRMKRQIFQGNSTVANITFNNSTQLKPQNTNNIGSIPVKESVNDSDNVLLSYPSNFEGNFQIQSVDAMENHFHPLWFLRPVIKKLSQAINYLNHPNTALTPAYIIKKLRDKALLVLMKTYKDICGEKIKF